MILILCTGNSCRSQMAEGILQKALGPGVQVASAGSKPTGYVHPLAIRTLAEIGIDISKNTSKHLDTYLREHVETVITVCDHAEQACPVFPGQRNRHHYPFHDPAHEVGSQEQQMAAFRRVRADIQRIFTAYAHGWLDGHHQC